MGSQIITIALLFYASLLLCLVSAERGRATRDSYNISLPDVIPNWYTFPEIDLTQVASLYEAEAQKRFDAEYQDKLGELKVKEAVAKKLPVSSPTAASETEADAILTQKVNSNRKAKVQYEFGQTNFNLVKVNKTEIKHALVETVVTAYNNHLPLELSPDDIWILIAQGVAQYLGGNKTAAEEHRKQFVDHEGRKQLNLGIGPNLLGEPGSQQNAEGWPIVIQMFGDAIKANEKSNLSSVMTAPFTTTGDIESAVASATLMETMKHYFEYKVTLLCGIPWVRLHGTVDDYRSIVQRLVDLKRLFPDFNWYLDRVGRLVQKLKKAIEGELDVDFWQKIVTSKQLGSGGPRTLSGWIGEMVAFKFRKGEQIRNRVQTDLEQLSLASSMTDVILESNGVTWQIKVVSGFLGTHQDPVTKALRPAMGWLTFVDQTTTRLGAKKNDTAAK